MEEMRSTITTLQTERDTFRDETKDLNQIKTQYQTQNQIILTATKEKLTKLDSKLKYFADQAVLMKSSVLKYEKQVKQLSDERDKLKERIKKIMAKKGNFDQSQKTCKNCSKDYDEKENFNWSCRVHSSEFGGEMWWCCGKKGKEQAGCKFSKHESKDDEENNLVDLDEKIKMDAMMLKNVRCNSCK